MHTRMREADPAGGRLSGFVWHLSKIELSFKANNEGQGALCPITTRAQRSFAMGEIFDLLSRHFTLESANTNMQTLTCAVVIWMTVVICTVTSIWSRPFSFSAKVCWAIIVLFIPLLGVLCYLPFAASGELFPVTGFWRPTKR